MSKAYGCDVKILQQLKVAPPPGSVPSTSLPLTFFDFVFLKHHSMQRIYVYDFPHSTNHFLHTFLPSLKNSLSLALSYFFPFSANLIFPPPPLIPHLLYVDCQDYVSLTIVESINVDFSDLIAHKPQPIQYIYPFVSELPSESILDDGTRVVPLMVLQVTIIPHSGFVIGVTFNHVASDASSFHHFMKTWASICKTGKWVNEEVSNKPYYNRDELRRYKDENFEVELLEKCPTWLITPKSDTPHILADVVRTTVLLSRAEIQNLKNWAFLHLQDQEEVVETPHISSYVVTCSLVWTCLVKAEEGDQRIMKNSTNAVNDDDDDNICCLVVIADCRNGNEDYCIPSTYFGNCLTMGVVRLEKKELVKEESGMVEAMRGIGNKVKEIKRRRIIRDAKRWAEDWKKEANGPKSNVVVVAGSPYHGSYETDFGFGKPKKNEIPHLERGGLIIMCQSRDEKGGIEVGLALTKLQMDKFQSIFKERLQTYAS